MIYEKYCLNGNYVLWNKIVLVNPSTNSGNLLYCITDQSIKIS